MSTGNRTRKLWGKKMAKYKTMFITQEGPANALATNKDATQVVIAGRNVFKIFSVHEDEFVEKVNLRVGKNINLNFGCADVVWNPIEDHILATAAANGAVVIWNLNKTSRSKQDMVFQQHKRTVNKVCFHPTDSNLLLSGSQDGTMKCFDLRMREVTNTFHSNSESVRDVQFSPTQNHRFAAVQENGCVQLWDQRRTDRYEKQFTAHSGPVFACDWHPTERWWLATAGRDKSIKVWDLGGRTNVEYAINTIASVARIRWRPHRKHHIASSALVVDFSVNIWDVRRPFIPFAAFNEHKDVTTGIAWRSSPQVFFSTGRDSKLYQHSFEDADRPADHANPMGLDVNSCGDVMFASSDRLLKDAKWRAAAKLPAVFQRTVSLGDQFPHAISTCLYLENHEEKNLSMTWFVDSAKRYILTGRSFGEMCDHNAQVANELGRHQVGQSWSMLKILFADTFNVSVKDTLRSAAPDAGDKTLSALEPTFGQEPGNGDQKSVRHYSGGAAAGNFRHHSGGGEPDTATGVSGEDTETDDTDFDRIADIASGLTQNIGDFFFGDGDNNRMQTNLEFDLDQLDEEPESTIDWTLPSEAFQTRHEILSQSPPMEQLCISTFSSQHHHHHHHNHHHHHHQGGAAVPVAVVGQGAAAAGGHHSAPVAEDTFLTARPDALVLPQWDQTSIVVELLHQYAAHGDVQMAVSVLLAMGDRLKGRYIDEVLLEQWFNSYIDLLTRFQLFSVSNQVIKLSAMPAVHQMNQHSTTINTGCNMCFRQLHRAGWLCDRCKSLTNTCSICHHVVKGLYVWCQGCCHGGHLQHIQEWMNTSRYCPTGCGHLCEYI